MCEVKGNANKSDTGISQVKVTGCVNCKSTVYPRDWEIEHAILCLEKS